MSSLTSNISKASRNTMAVRDHLHHGEHKSGFDDFNIRVSAYLLDNPLLNRNMGSAQL